MADIKLFERTENTNPNLAQRIAFGRASNASENMTLTNFITWLNGKLGFLKVASNLSDGNAATMRTNLGVYSSTQVNTLLTDKAGIHPAAGGALKNNNTAAFTPSADYHPATKKYVDDTAIVPLYRGLYVIGDTTGGLETKTINFASVGTTAYTVLGSWKENGTGLISVPSWKTRSHGATSFVLDYVEAGSGTNNLTFYFMIIPTASFTDVTPS
jgi:hypothetical protein